MQTKLSPEFEQTVRGTAADAILRNCVHCGFCNATCPTYQILGDELDGPRGRIYLIKQLLEGGEAGRSTQVHLDRCLTCLACETTCPSGVEYGKLVTIGREIVEERVRRPPVERMTRWLLKVGLRSALFAPLYALARHLRPLLPALLRDKIAPGGSRAVRPGAHARKVLLLSGCVQPAMMPNIDAATLRVLDAVGIQGVFAAGAGCCGALPEHLSDPESSRADARRNIDAWWPLVEAGAVEAIVVNASACALAVKHYGEALRLDPAYADKAARVAAMARDLSELLPELAPRLAQRLAAHLSQGGGRARIAVHSPCTLQHGQRLRGTIESQLAGLGFDVGPAPADAHLCCGSAGTYSILQPDLSRQLRDRKLSNLLASEPQCIVSANIGCLQHLQSGTAVPVRHWIEILDEALAAR